MTGIWMPVCFCDSCKKKYFEKTGRELPTVVDLNDPTFMAYFKFKRECVAEYQRCIRETALSIKPNITVTFQSALIKNPFFYGQGAEFCAECDYLSGDFHADLGLYDGNVIARLYQKLSNNLPYEYMIGRCAGTPSKSIDHLHSSARKQEKAAERARHAQGKNCRKPDGTWGYANWREEESSSTSATSAPVARTGGTWAEKYGKKIIAWDVAPEEEVFDEIFRVSKNQIIWGGNYFDLPPTRCFLVWRKLTISEAFSMAMAEYAWTSFNSNAKVFEAAPQGRPGDTRFHPTQKPIELYDWIYSQFTKPGDKVFDPFLGSGSSRIAAYNAGLDFVGCEIDEFYFKKQEERFEQQTAQMSFFTEQE